jgi:hypothetical protein
MSSEKNIKLLDKQKRALYIGLARSRDFAGFILDKRAGKER